MKRKLFENYGDNVFKLKEEDTYDIPEYDPTKDIERDPANIAKDAEERDTYMQDWESVVANSARKEAPVLQMMAKNSKTTDEAVLVILSYFYMRLNKTVPSVLSPEDKEKVKNLISQNKFKEIWIELSHAHS